MLPQKRMDYIDIAKGIGMLTIIWGHINLGPSNIFVYAFHIPLFFFLSGLVYRGEKYPTFKEFVIRKIKSLVIPYLFFSFITWIVWASYSVIFHKEVDSYWMPLFQTFVAQGSGGFLVHNVPLWFVPCLLLVEFMYYLISRQGKDIVTVTICCALAVLSYLMEKSCFIFDFRLLPWSIGTAFAAMIFYCSGNLFMKYGITERIRDRIKNRVSISYTVLAIMTVVLVVLSAINGHVSMGHEEYNNRLLFYTNGYLGTFCVLMFSMLLNSNWPRKSWSWIQWIGINSMFFMFVENPIKGFVVTILARIVHISEEKVAQSFTWSITAFFISVLASIIAVKLIHIINENIKNKDKNHA